jgi:hypothetical protein
MIPSLPSHPIPSPFLSSPASSFPPSLPSFPPLPFEWGSGAGPENFWNDICLQVTFSEFWVLNSMFYWTGFFVHKKFLKYRYALVSFSAFMQQYDELGFLNINLSLGTYLDDWFWLMKAAVQHFMCMMSVIRLALLRDIFLAVWTGKSTSKRTRFLNQQLL